MIDAAYNGRSTTPGHRRTGGDWKWATVRQPTGSAGVGRALDPREAPDQVPVWIRRAVVIVLFGHGLIHLLGVAKGLGWVEVAQFTGP